MEFGPFRVFTHDHGSYRLDGGAMFGTIPKTLWSRELPADADNRIKLATRSLVVEAGGRTLMVDAGNGEKGSDKFRAIYEIRNAPALDGGFDTAAVTDLVLTHLHFDHAGGVSRYVQAGPPEVKGRAFGSPLARGLKPRASTAEADPRAKPGAPTAVELCYPEATHYVQAANFENAKAPNARERASYLAENVLVLERGKRRLTEGSEEILPGIWVHRSDGHTRGLQWVEVRNDAESIVFPSDLIPTSRHIPLAYTMGYDICAEALLVEKESLLRRAAAGRWIVVFVHDPDIPAARVAMDAQGRFSVGEVVRI